MNAARAKRRWIAWCRYVQHTQSEPTGGNAWALARIHRGHAKAYQDAMFAKRWYPKGARAVWYPSWGSTRRH